VLLELTLAQTTALQLTLIDSSNKQVWVQNLNQDRVLLPIDLSQLPKGVYYLQIQTGLGMFSRKLMKQ
jgi:hypothetical protein